MGKSPPRASLSVTILDDDDFHVLMAMPSGLETFGAFCSLLVVGRERFQQGKAIHLGETESLVFINRLSYVLSRARINRKQLDMILATLRAVAEETDTLPWLSLDGDRLVIRSFFKYHSPPDKNWGGTRPGAGRKIKNQDDSENNQDDSLSETIKMIPGNNQDDSLGNQDESFGNHLEKNKESSRKPPVSNSDSIADANPVSQSAGAPACEAGLADCPAVSYGSHQECVEVALDLFGDATADALGRSRASLADRLDDGMGNPRWDALAAALRVVDRMRRKPGAEPIRSIIGTALHLTADWIVTGEVPPEPVEAPVIASVPRRRTNGDDTVLPPPFRPTEEQLARFGPPPGAPKPPDAAGPPRFKNMAEFAAEFAARKNLKLRHKDEP